MLPIPHIVNMVTDFYTRFLDRSADPRQLQIKIRHANQDLSCDFLGLSINLLIHLGSTILDTISMKEENEFSPPQVMVLQRLSTRADQEGQNRESLDESSRL